MIEQQNIKDAKKVLKSHIKFFEILLNHIKKGEEPLLSRAMWAAWCLNQYINDKFIHDIERALKENG